MAGFIGSIDSSGKLPAGMWFYAFMFGDKKPLVSDYVLTGRLPAPSSLFLGLGAGIVLTAVRLALDFSIFKPMARSILGFSERPFRPRIPVLEALCSRSKILSPEEIDGATASTGLSPEEVREYARVRRVSLEEVKKMAKFKEAAWRLVVYAVFVAWALKLAYEEPWFKDPTLVWENWPAGDHGGDLEVYYHCAMGLYWHFIIFQIWDTKRSDFWQMLLHHVATLFLLTYSWLMSLVRIGALIMLCHDVSDIFLESAKLFNYSQKRFHWCHLAADVVFFFFAAVFGVSRLYVFPKYMVLNVWQTTALSEVSRLFFCGLLGTLLLLHIFWFSLILRMVYMFVAHGVEEDIRSDNEGEQEGAGGHKSIAANGNGHHKGTKKSR